MPEAKYRTGTAAKMLGLSSYHLRRLAETELIDAEFTGHEWRFPASEIDRLLKEGVPEIPAASQDPIAEAAGARNGNDRQRAGGQDADPHMAAGKTPEVVQAYAGAARKQAIIEEREADWQLMDIEDRFRRREQEQANETVERLRKQKRPAWQAKWVKYAVDSIPEGAHGEYEPAVVKAARAELAAMSPDDDDAVVESVMDATVRKVLRKYYWMRDAAEAVEFAKEVLPSDLRNYWSHLSPTEWEDKAMRAASLAIANAADAAGDGDLNFLPIERMEEIATAAGARVVAEYRTQQQARAEGERRRHVKERVTGPLYSRLDRKRRADADYAIDISLAALPPEADDDELAEEAQAAAAPWSQPLAQADEQERRRQIRESVISGAWWYMRQLPREQRELPLADVRRELEDANPASQREAEEIRDRTLKPHLDGYEQRRQAEEAEREKQRQVDERRKAAERRIDSLLLDTVDGCIRGMEQRGRLKFKYVTDRVDYEFKVKAAIRPALVDRFARITNLHMLSDEAIKREISQAARDWIERHMPRQAA